jgi:hypothetical protein
MDPDRDPSIFAINLQDAKKTNLKKRFLLLFKDKSQNEVTKQ